MSSRVVHLEPPVQPKKNERLEYGDLLLHYLHKEGVKHVFGIPGGALEPFYNALARSQANGEITPVLTKHEQGAAFMADGYARVSGKIGVCCATTGPGATNLLTGIAASYADSVPVMAITGQIPTESYGKGAVQDSTQEGVDMVEIFRRTTRFSDVVFSPKLADSMFRKAIRCAMSGRRGPVHLSLPSDVVATQVDVEALNRGMANCYMPARYWDREGVKEAAKLLQGARQPAMLVGTGALWSGASDEIRELAETLTIPTATTPKAKGVFPEDHELSLGCFGFAGSPRSEAYLLEENIDVLLSIGTSFNEMSTNAWNESLDRGRIIIQVDIDPYQFGKNYTSNLPLNGDAKVVIRELLYEIERHKESTSTERKVRSMRFEKFCDAHPIMQQPEMMESPDMPLKPQRLMADLRAALPDETIFFVDIGNNMAWAIHCLQITRPGTFFAPIAFSPMGYGVAACIGGKLAAPDKPVVAIVGDGGFLMTGMEVTTALNYNVPVIWVILNDGGLGMVRHGQRMSEHASEICSDFQMVDFAKVAKGLGVQSIRVTQPGTLSADLMNQLLSSGKPAVIDVVIDPDESPPIGQRIKALGDVYDES